MPRQRELSLHLLHPIRTYNTTQSHRLRFTLDDERYFNYTLLVFRHRIIILYSLWGLGYDDMFV